MWFSKKKDSDSNLESKVGGISKTFKTAVKVGIWGTVGLYFTGVGLLSLSMCNTLSNGSSYPGYDMPQVQQAKKRDHYVALIPVSGVISSDAGASANSNALVTYIDSAIESGTDGFIFEIDSPGGVVLPSKDIMERIKRIDQPKVALIRNVGASGAYWIASACDYIIADETSTVGSIGVRMDRFDVSELMRKLGIKYDPVYAGEHKTMGTPFQELSDEDRRILEDMMVKLHELFITTVASNRGMEVEKLRPLADGRVFLGKDALENGLVDALGGRSDAALWMYSTLHDQPFEIEVYQQSQQKGIFGITSSFGQAVGEGVGRVLIEYTIKQP